MCSSAVISHMTALETFYSSHTAGHVTALPQTPDANIHRNPHAHFIVYLVNESADLREKQTNGERQAGSGKHAQIFQNPKANKC